MSIIAAVAAVVVGATTAYFSDTETSAKNTLSAGTIDIAIDDQNPWERTGYNLGDLKPSETGYINFRINNVGQNPVNISKTLKSIVGNGGATQNYVCANIGNVSSEPECVAEKVLQHREDDIQKVIIYDLAVEVYDASQNKIWWQTIYSDDEGKSIADVYGTGGGTPVKLGMIPVGGYMLVTQSYHLSGKADNEYQGDGLTFDIEIRGDQLNQSGGATVTLEDKTGPTEWNIIENDIKGVLTYQTKGSEFEYGFNGKAPVGGVSYSLIYASDPWPQNGILIDTAVSGASGAISMNGSKDLGTDLPASYDANLGSGAKIWLVLSNDYTTDHMTGWNPSSYLFETALINYDDTDL